MALEYCSFQSADGAEIFYVEQGDGRPLVYVLGFGDTIQTSQLLLSHWSRDFHCVLFDHRGFGKSPLTRNVGVEQSARDLHELLLLRDLHDVALVGYSMGGSVVFSYLDQFGTDRVGRLAFVDTSPQLVNDKTWKLGLWQGRYTREDFEFDLRLIVENPALFHMSFFLHVATPSSVEVPPEFPAPLDSEAWFAAVVAKTGLRERLVRNVFFKNYSEEHSLLERKYWDSMTGSSWFHVLPRIDVPTFCLFATPGSLYSPATGKWLVDRLPNASLDVITNSTHLCIRDNPTEFISKISRFCR